MKHALAAITAILFTAGSAALAQPSRQPEVVCDLKPVLAGTIEAGQLRTRDDAEPIRLTFRDLDPKAGTGKVLFGAGASGEEFVAVTVEAAVITYLHERAGVSKMIVTTANKPTPEGWPAVMSQHGSGSGAITIRAATGFCRMRARRSE